MNLLVCSLLTAAFFPWSAAAAEKIRVSSFSTILTEIANSVGGDRVAVTAHVKAGIDPHDFEPKPADMQLVGDADLILLSAKHMESYVRKLNEAAGAKGRMIEVGNGFLSLKMPDENDSKRTVEDPHWWHSIDNLMKATEIVRDALIKSDPASQEWFTAHAANYLESLQMLQKWARTKIAELPRDRRKLVTSHDAFQYFAKDFGFTIHAIEGVSSADQPSSRKVGGIIAAIRAEGVRAIFPESIENPKVMKEIMRETGVKVGGELYADGLGEGEAATYAGMYRHNVNAIVEGLK